MQNTIIKHSEHEDLIINNQDNIEEANLTKIITDKLNKDLLIVAIAPQNNFKEAFTLIIKQIMQNNGNLITSKLPLKLKEHFKNNKFLFKKQLYEDKELKKQCDNSNFKKINSFICYLKFQYQYVLPIKINVVTKEKAEVVNKINAIPKIKLADADFKSDTVEQLKAKITGSWIKTQVVELNKISFDEQAFIVDNLLVYGQKMNDADLYCSNEVAATRMTQVLQPNRVTLMKNNLFSNQFLARLLTVTVRYKYYETEGQFDLEINQRSLIDESKQIIEKIKIDYQNLKEEFENFKRNSVKEIKEKEKKINNLEAEKTSEITKHNDLKSQHDQLLTAKIKVETELNDKLAEIQQLEKEKTQKETDLKNKVSEIKQLEEKKNKEIKELTINNEKAINEKITEIQQLKTEKASEISKYNKLKTQHDQLEINKNTEINEKNAKINNLSALLKIEKENHNEARNQYNEHLITKVFEIKEKEKIINNLEAEKTSEITKHNDLKSQHDQLLTAKIKVETELNDKLAKIQQLEKEKTQKETDLKNKVSEIKQLEEKKNKEIKELTINNEKAIKEKITEIQQLKTEKASEISKYNKLKTQHDQLEIDKNTEINKKETELKEKEKTINEKNTEIQNIIDFHEIENELRNKIFEKPLQFGVSRSTIGTIRIQKNKAYPFGVNNIIQKIKQSNYSNEFKELLSEKNKKLYVPYNLNISKNLYLNPVPGSKNFLPEDFFNTHQTQQTVYCYFTYRKNYKYEQSEELKIVEGKFVPLELTVYF